MKDDFLNILKNEDYLDILNTALALMEKATGYFRLYEEVAKVKLVDGHVPPDLVAKAKAARKDAAALLEGTV